MCMLAPQRGQRQVANGELVSMELVGGWQASCWRASAMRATPACAGEIAEVADADETSGQHMLAEAAQELACGECHDALLVAVRIVFPSKAYAVTIEAQQALIADGYAVSVAAEIAQHVSRLRQMRAWHRPPNHCCSNVCTRVEEKSGATLTGYALKEIEKLAAKDAAEDLDGEEKAYLG